MIIFGLYIEKWRKVQQHIRDVQMDSYAEGSEAGYSSALSQVEPRITEAYNRGRADERKQTLAAATKVLTEKE